MRCFLGLPFIWSHGQPGASLRTYLSLSQFTPCIRHVMSTTVSKAALILTLWDLASLSLLCHHHHYTCWNYWQDNKKKKTGVKEEEVLFPLQSPVRTIDVSREEIPPDPTHQADGWAFVVTRTTWNLEYAGREEAPSTVKAYRMYRWVVRGGRTITTTTTTTTTTTWWTNEHHNCIFRQVFD